MKRTASQNARLYGLFTSLSITGELKKDLVFQFTGGRTEKSSEMEYRECQSLIESLEHNLKKQKQSQAEIMQKSRRTVFKLMYDIGLIDSKMNTGQKIGIINRWIEVKTAFQGNLNNLSYDELQTVITQLNAVRRRYDEKYTKQARYN